MPRWPLSFEERFRSRIERRGDSECWLWTGSPMGFGYGRLWREDRFVVAHRVAWELAFGPIPEGLWVLHRCDVPPCVNPSHLFVGTSRDNMADCKARYSRDLPESQRSGLNRRPLGFVSRYIGALTSVSAREQGLTRVESEGRNRENPSRNRGGTGDGR